MKFDQLTTFMACYQTQNFAAVAKDLDVAASSVSRSISALETELNVRLFHRTTRNIKPTQAGELFYQRILPLVEEFQRIEQDVLTDSVQPTGRIRITATTSFGQIVIAPLLKKFTEEYPKISVDLNLSDNRLDMIEEQVDLAIRHGKLPDSGLISRKLCDVNYLLVASPTYLAQSDSIQHPRDLATHTTISFSYENFSRQWYFRKDADEEIIDIQPNLTISNAATIRECAKNHFGIAMLADWTVKSDIASGELIHLLPDWTATGKEKSNSIWLMQPSRKFVPEKVKVFKAFLLDHCCSKK